jgi:non-canonical (house-cleaning) NTP pyrophosphatase
MKTCIYLTSKNFIKEQVVREFLNNNYQLICVESNSEIRGGQPYGYDETLLGCKNRTKQFKENENYISIENGIVKLDKNTIYDIAVIIININGKNITEWSKKRYFPIEILKIPDIYTRTRALVSYFEKNNETRYMQLKETINKFKIYLE